MKVPMPPWTIGALLLVLAVCLALAAIELVGWERLVMLITSERSYP